MKLQKQTEISVVAFARKPEQQNKSPSLGFEMKKEQFTRQEERK